ncbi:MAG: ATP-dependent RNA helicase DbpA [Pseudomonadota bacterium]|jgi:ATP-independent RNA helicase DbpA
MRNFAQLALPPPLVQSIDAAGYTEPTPIQAAALPAILSGRDVIGQARTGSGKTVAFALGLLAALDVGATRLQGLVLCPTRELADQVSREIRKLARFIPNVKVLTLCGGVPLRPHLASLTHEPHLVVGTPGRILELIEQDALPLAGIRVLVLDEADRMLDMGFADDIGAVVGKLPRERQTLLFSATFPDDIRALSRRFQCEPIEVTVAAPEGGDDIEQWFVEVDAPRKADALAAILSERAPESTLVFCNTRHDTRAVAEDLERRGFGVLALHGELDQREREEMLVRFANRSARVLVATDVAARGLDIVGLPLVVNYDVASDADIHLHRVGRTGRAGASGVAITLCAPKEATRANVIEARQGKPLRWAKAPTARGKALVAGFATLAIDAGRQDKLRPGDVLGALTGSAGLTGDAVGKIDVFPTRTYVAVVADKANAALARLRAGKIKGRTLRVRKIG